MSTDKLYTVELKRILTLMGKDLLEEYPNKKLTAEYFIVSLLNNKQCLAYKILSRIMTSNNLSHIYDYYAKYLHDHALSILPPNVKDKQISYDVNLSLYLTSSKDEKDKLNDPKISTEHVLLALLKDNDGNNIAKQFSSMGVTYDTFYSEIIEYRNDENKKKDDEKELVESIAGIKPKNSRKSNIEAYCVNLNKLSQQGKIDKIIGREKEINRVIKIMGRRNKNNIIFVGLNGTGKTAIVYGLVNMIEEGKAMSLNGKTILSLNMTSIIAGTIYRGMLEERMNGIISEIKSNKDYILFIDDIHTVLSTNSNTSSDLAGILSNALSEGNIQLIATTSFKEYKSSIESNVTLSRRFQKIIIDPTSIEETENILSNIKSHYEQYHNVRYSDGAIKACVYLANKHITERQLPDSAIDIMDEAGSEKKVYNENLDELIELKKELSIAEEKKVKSMRMNDFKLGDVYNKQCKELQAKIIDYQKEKKYTNKNNIKDVSEEDIYITVSEMTGIPLKKLSISEKQKFLNIEKVLNSRIIGQEEAINKVAQTIKRNRMGLDRKNRPTGVFLLVGDSGVGKTLLAKKLAEEIYGGENYMVRFDMSEYSDKTSLNKLYGTGPGYVGFENGGQLTEAIKNKKHCVLLLDEIEKADKDVYNVFLQIFDDGNLTDNTGQKVSFKNVIIIMTSNVGARDAATLSRSAGFVSNIEENKKTITDKALRQQFSPEFLNRLDNVIYFNRLTDDNLKKIIELELNNLKTRLNDIGYDIEFNDEIINYLFKLLNGDKNTGARKIGRIIQTELENMICDLYLESEYENGHVFKVKIENDKIKIN